MTQPDNYYITPMGLLRALTKRRPHYRTFVHYGVEFEFSVELCVPYYNYFQWLTTGKLPQNAWAHRHLNILESYHTPDNEQKCRAFYEPKLVQLPNLVINSKAMVIEFLAISSFNRLFYSEYEEHVLWFEHYHSLAKRWCCANNISYNKLCQKYFIL